MDGDANKLADAEAAAKVTSNPGAIASCTACRMNCRNCVAVQSATRSDASSTTTAASPSSSPDTSTARPRRRGLARAAVAVAAVRPTVVRTGAGVCAAAFGLAKRREEGIDGAAAESFDSGGRVTAAPLFGVAFASQLPRSCTAFGCTTRRRNWLALPADNATPRTDARAKFGARVGVGGGRLDVSLLALPTPVSTTSTASPNASVVSAGAARAACGSA